MKTSEIPVKPATRRYRAFGQYMKDLYHAPVYKVNVDAGFTCPNRDGSIATGGCIYCNNDSFRPAACTSSLSLHQQIEKGIPYLRSRYGAEKFIVYFQPFTNTYASVDILERLYREALNNPGVVGLAIGTRPDCIDRAKIALLERLAREAFILVEYGLQSVYDATLQFINRGHDYACFQEAVRLTAGTGVHVGAHLILGFPTETRDQMLAMAGEISRQPIEFLKIHQLQVVKGTALADHYEKAPFPTFTYEEYIAMLADFLELLSPDIILQRLFAAAPDDILVAPVWNKTRSEVLRDLDAYMEQRGTHQGKKTAA
ncbi:MAG: TIGR01212 family radical SAM protein [Nitrospirae bacterium GWC2_57_9]|nr:MAG: TIGR01212 family radical SAM protein [Nitrospirae bacterium GWC2_57_9]